MTDDKPKSGPRNAGKNNTHQSTAPDGGYGWLVVLCSFLTYLMFGANFIIFSVYLTEFADYLNVPQTDISVIGSMDAACMMLTGINQFPAM